jgi:RNA polymerase sigma factor (sigma-70 family)
MNIPENYYDEFEEDLHDPNCVQEIYNFIAQSIRGLVEYNDENDIIQEVFYSLTKWPMQKKYNSKRHYFSLLKITIRQIIASYWRRKHSQRNDIRRRTFISQLQHDSHKRTFTPKDKKTRGVEHYPMMKEAVALVLKKVDTLEEKEKAYFRLRFIEEKSHETIASLLNISLRTSYRFEHKVRKILVEYFENKELF